MEQVDRTQHVQRERLRRVARIQRLSAIMKWFVTLFMAMVLLAAVLLVLSLSWPDFFVDLDDTLEVGAIERPILEIPLMQRLGFSALVVAAFGMILGMCWQVRQAFSHFQKGDYFQPGTLSCIVALGFWLIGFGVFEVISDMIGSVLLTLDYPAGERQLEIDIDGGEVFFLTFGALMLVFGWIMREAATIDEENKLFV